MKARLLQSSTDSSIRNTFIYIYIYSHGFSCIASTRVCNMDTNEI